MGGTDPGALFVRWIWCRAVLHRGWWLVTSVYLVVDARLTASQLVLIGVAQAGAALVLEVPAGVVADTLSRKWSLVASQLLMGVAMLATGLVTGFPALVATQMLWGLSWNFAGGADVAWVSDELDDPARAPAVLVRSEQAQLLGTVAGPAAIGALAWLIGPAPAMVIAGVAMLLLGGYVAIRFPERRFVPIRARRWPAAWSILQRGARLIGRSRVLLAIFAATFLVNGVADAFGRLYPLRLVALAPELGPIVWFTGLSVLTCLTGAAALRFAQPRIGDPRAVRRGYLIAVAGAALGVAGLALAPGAAVAGIAVLLASAGLGLTRSFATIWVNGRTAGPVRATVHSLFAQGEYAGKICCGLAIAGLGGTVPALVACCALLVGAITVVRLGSAP